MCRPCHCTLMEMFLQLGLPPAVIHLCIYAHSFPIVIFGCSVILLRVFVFKSADSTRSCSCVFALGFFGPCQYLNSCTMRCGDVRFVFSYSLLGFHAGSSCGHQFVNRRLNPCNVVRFLEDFVSDEFFLNVSQNSDHVAATGRWIPSVHQTD